MQLVTLTLTPDSFFKSYGRSVTTPLALSYVAVCSNRYKWHILRCLAPLTCVAMARSLPHTLLQSYTSRDAKGKLKPKI